MLYHRYSLGKEAMWKAWEADEASGSVWRGGKEIAGGVNQEEKWLYLLVQGKREIEQVVLM